MITDSTKIFYLTVYLILTGCTGSSGDETTVPADSSQHDSTTQWGEPHTNAQYDVSLQTPQDWILLEEPNLKPGMGTFAINLFKRGTMAGEDTPLNLHAKAKHSYVAIWPYGIGTELPYSQYEKFSARNNAPTLQFQLNQEKSKVLTFKDGSAWAYFMVPQNPPSSWKKYGFIFAQIASTNNSATCYDEETGNELPLKKCDFLGGDRYEREGDLNRQDAQTMRKVLESISLDSVKEETKASDLIQVEKPLPNMDVTSPVTIKGKARGQWYFEGSFLVELFDAYGNKLAEKQAQARGEWTTENFVPFSVTLEFEAPDDQRGRLVLHKANPSGRSENARSYSLPVIFPPK